MNRGTAGVRKHHAGHAAVGGGLAILGLCVVLIGTHWETPVRDDWSYYLTVQNLLSGGHYRLDAWATADPAAQVFWGAALAKLFGLSFQTLRISTIVLSAGGLVAMYGLALEHGLTRRGAALSAIGLAATGVVIKLTFSFMTDVPLLAFMLVALWLMTRALRTGSLPVMTAASFAGAAAVLSRPQGIAAGGALVVVWMTDPLRRQRARLYLVGCSLPAIAFVHQVLELTLSPTWFQVRESQATASYLHSSQIITGLLWRPGLIALYLSAFALPFGVAALLTLAVRIRSIGRPGGVTLIATVVVATALIVCRFFAPEFTTNLSGDTLHSGEWGLSSLGGDEEMVLGVTVLAAPVAVLLVVLFWQRCASLGTRRRDDLPATLLDWSTILSAAALIGFPGMFDEYLLPCLPLTLLLFVRAIDNRQWRLHAGVVIVAIAVSAQAAFTVRAELSTLTAGVHAADYAVAHGVPPAAVDADWTWYGWHNFDAYAATHPTTRQGFSPLFVNRESRWTARVAFDGVMPGETVVGSWACDCPAAGGHVDLVVHSGDHLPG